MFRNGSLGSAYEGTQQILTCTVMPSHPTPDPIIIDIQWNINGEAVMTEEDRITITSIDSYSSELTFSPVGDADSGVYQCTAVVATTNQNVLNATGMSNNHNFTVDGMF